MLLCKSVLMFLLFQFFLFPSHKPDTVHPLPQTIQCKSPRHHVILIRLGSAWCHSPSVQNAINTIERGTLNIFLQSQQKAAAICDAMAIGIHTLKFWWTVGTSS